MRPYADIVIAERYFSERMFTEPWDNASEDSRLRALKHATTIIDALSFRGVKVQVTQEQAFPRYFNQNYPNYTPSAIVQACCEIALALLSGVNPDEEQRAVNRTSVSYGQLRESTDVNVLRAWVTAGVPSPTAWTLLEPWLSTQQTCILERA